jgi:carbon-monoxide dehydrogenase small subunit
MSKDKKKKPKEVTRRQFLAGTGIVVGGAAIGSAALLAACGGDGGTETVTQTQTQTQTATQTVTTTQQVGTATVTSTLPGTTQTVTTTVMIPGETIEGGTTLNVNGWDYIVKIKSNWSLAYVIREKLGLTGTKRGCDLGQCGSCTLIMDGRPVLSCMVLAVEAEGTAIETIEGVGVNGELDPIQQAFIDYDAMQCGFCTPGFIMSAKYLLGVNPNPTADEVNEALAGNLCRCSSHQNILAAVLAAAG